MPILNPQTQYRNLNKIDYGNSAGFNWVHNPFLTEIPTGKAAKRRDKAKPKRAYKKRTSIQL
jgi:hypothetical protein